MKYTIDVKEGKKYDVIVCGGGTAGVVASIAAARQGASVLLIERTFSVGGMLTLGNAGITKFTEHCRDVDKYKSEVIDVLAKEAKKVQVVGGIANEYVKRLIADNNALGTSEEAGSYVFTDRYQAQLTLINMLEEAGVDILYDTRVCMVNVSDGVVKSVVVDNKEGFTEIYAERFVDATGDADVAYMAGVPCRKGATDIDIEEGGATHIGELLQMGTMYKVRNVNFAKVFEYLKKNPERFFQHEFGVMSLQDAEACYNRGEMCVFRILLEYDNGQIHPVQVYNLPQKDEAILLGKFCGAFGYDGLDAYELSKAQHILQKGASINLSYVRNIPGFEDAVIVNVPDAGVRETRHIDGEYMLTGLDVVSSKKFEDSIACGGHPIDIHPLPPEIEHMDMNHWRFYIPYRVLVPKNVDNLIVAGRCISATRMASGAIRPTAQCMAMGEAAGVASAISIKDNVSFRDVNVAKLQKILVDNGGII